MEDLNFRKSLPLLFLLSLFHSFTIIIVPIFLSTIGLSGYEIGILVSIYAFMAVFVSFPTGFVNDRWTVRFTIILGLLLISSYFFGLGFFNNFFALIPFYFAGGLGANLVEVSIRTVAFKAKTDGRDGWKFGKYQLVRTFGVALGLFGGGLMVFFTDFPSALIIIGLIHLLFIPLVSFETVTRSRIKLGEYKKDILNGKVMFAGMIMLVFSTHWGAESTSYGLFLVNNLNLDMFMVGLYNAGTVIFLGITAYVFGRRIDSRKNSLKNLMIIGMIISGVFHIVHTIPILHLSFFFRIIHEVGDGIVWVSMLFWVARLFGKERIGGNSSFMFTLAIFGQIVGSMIYGPLGYHLGYHVPLIMSGITTVLCAFLLMAFTKIYKIREIY